MSNLRRMDRFTRPTGAGPAARPVAPRRLGGILAVVAAAGLFALPAFAPAAELCKSTVEGAAGKMLACRLQAESKNSRSPDPARRDAALLKCEASFRSVFGGALQRYGSTACTPVAQGELQSYLGRVANAVEVASRRDGLLPSCDADLQACSADLGECSAQVEALVAERDALAIAAGTCNADLDTCRTSLAATGATLATCRVDRDAATASLAACTTAGSTCSSDLATCNATKSACATSLATCTSGAATCAGDLASCRADGSACDASLANCGSNADACAGDLSDALSTLAAARSGDAVSSQVLAGRAFTSAAGDGVVGTMPNRGAITIVPASAPGTIPAGFHDGNGTVAGDPALVPANIRAGQTIFGVAGSAETSPGNLLVQSGETANYGYGSDGGLQVGSSPSFVDNGDGTVTDRRTGLTWEKKSRDGSLHDVDATFTWGQSTAPFALNGSVASDFLAALDTVPCFAGHCDWRLPNQRELQSIADFGRSAPAIAPAFDAACAPGCDVTGCSCTAGAAGSDLAWTATTLAASPADAWAVGFASGAMSAVRKDTPLRVRAVRGGTSPTDLCAAADLDPSDALASAACRAIAAFARDDFQFARDYLLADVVARRFRVPALAGMWPMFLQAVVSADAGAKLYTRIGDASKTATLADLAPLEGVDAATAPALFCKSLPYPSGYADLLATDLALGGYETTHVLLALLWIRDQGCVDPTPAGFRDQALAASADLIDGDHAAITDLELESAALLAALGAPGRIPAGFLPGVLAAQLPSGAWRAGPGEAPLGHTTGLALWYLHELRFPGSPVPSVSALPR